MNQELKERIIKIILSKSNKLYPGITVIIRDGKIVTHLWNALIDKSCNLNCHHSEAILLKQSMIKNGDTLVMTHPTCGHCRDKIHDANIFIKAIYFIDHKDKANTFLKKSNNIEHININEINNTESLTKVLENTVRENIRSKRGHTLLKNHLG